MPGIPTPTSPPQRHWLITSPRSASNLFVKIINLEEQNVRPTFHGGYFFFDAALHRRQVSCKPFDKWTAKEMKDVIEKQQKAFDTLQEYIDASEAEGQKVFVKEHANFVAEAINENRLNYPDNEEPPTMVIARHLTTQTRSETNRTSLPDEYLKTWMPTFLIRHPALVYPSLFRVLRNVMPDENPDDGAYKGEMTMTWQRSLYDFYAQHFASQKPNGSSNETDGIRWPIVLDADDIMTRPDMVVKYAKLVGLDHTKLQFEWESIPEEALKKMDIPEREFRSTINSSTGIRQDKVAGDNLDISEHAAKWREEFGEHASGYLEQWVRDAMPDYEYMKSQRLRPE
jgi:hypothetical protein